MFLHGQGSQGSRLLRLEAWALADAGILNGRAYGISCSQGLVSQIPFVRKNRVSRSSSPSPEQQPFSKAARQDQTHKEYFTISGLLDSCGQAFHWGWKQIHGKQHLPREGKCRWKLQAKNTVLQLVYYIYMLSSLSMQTAGLGMMHHLKDFKRKMMEIKCAGAPVMAQQK